MLSRLACHQRRYPVWRGTLLEIFVQSIQRGFADAPSRLCASLLICALAGCGGKNTTVSTPPPPAPAPLATATFGPGGGASVTVPLANAQQRSPAEIFGSGPVCTLRAGTAPMVFTAGSSSTWFGVTPQFGNLQPSGTTSIGISSIIWSNVVTAGENNGFVIVTASGYNQLTGFTFFIRAAGTDRVGNRLVSMGYACP